MKTWESIHWQHIMYQNASEDSENMDNNSWKMLSLWRREKKRSHEEEHWNHFRLKLISSVIFLHTLYLFVYFESQAFWRYWREKKRMLKIWYERLKIWLVTELMKRKLVKKTLDRERGNRVKYTKGWIIWVSLKLVNNRMKVNERRSLVLLLFCQ